MQRFFLVNVLDMRYQILTLELLSHVAVIPLNADYGGISSTVAENTLTLFESATTYIWDKPGPYIPIDCGAAYAKTQNDQFGYDET